jgi:hypothetical protein
MYVHTFVFLCRSGDGSLNLYNLVVTPGTVRFSNQDKFKFFASTDLYQRP